MALRVLALSLGISTVIAHPTIKGIIQKPSSGDPAYNITCLGNAYDLQLPVRMDGIDPNTFIMQQLCAKTVYGGAPAGQHLGGWCARGLNILKTDSDGESMHEDPDETMELCLAREAYGMAL